MRAMRLRGKRRRGRRDEYIKGRTCPVSLWRGCQPRTARSCKDEGLTRRLCEAGTRRSGSQQSSAAVGAVGIPRRQAWEDVKRVRSVSDRSDVGVVQVPQHREACCGKSFLCIVFESAVAAVRPSVRSGAVWRF